MNRTEYLCDECYYLGVNKELFVRMTQFFQDYPYGLEIPDEIRQHMDLLNERNGMIMASCREVREGLEDAVARDTFIKDKKYIKYECNKDELEKKMIAEMKQEYLMEDCPSWRRLEIQQDLSTYNELVPNLPFTDDE